MKTIVGNVGSGVMAVMLSLTQSGAGEQLLVPRVFRPVNAHHDEETTGLKARGTAVEDIDRLLVIDGLGETMTLIDRAGDSVVKEVMTLGLVPNRIRLGGERALVVNSVSDDLWVINPNTFTRERRVAFADGDNPWDVAFVRDTLCVVSMLVTSEIAFVNQTGGYELTRIAVGKSPQGVLAQGDRVWVANTGFDFGTFLYDPGTVSVVNVDSRSIIATIPVGTNPQALDQAPDGTIHVLCTGNFFNQFGIVYVIDTASLTVIDSLPIGGSPGEIVVASDGLGYIAAGGFADSGDVYRYNAISRTALNTAANPWRTARGTVAVVERLEGGVDVVCFSADSIIEHARSGSAARGWEVGDGPVHAVAITNRRPGDVNEDGARDVLDVVGLVNLAFRGGGLPPRPGSADVNADCIHNVLDVVAMVAYVFRNGHVLYWGCA